MGESVTLEIYDARTGEQLGFVRSLAMLGRALTRYWPQIRVNMVQDWANIYRGSYLGIFWTVVMAIVPMSVFMLISALGIFTADGAYPAGVYISTGITVWMVVAETITLSIGSLRGLSHSLADAQTPLIVPLISRYSILLSDTLIRFLALVVWLLLAGVPFRLSLLLTPLLFLPVFAFSMGLGLILAAFNIVVSDIEQLTGMVLRYAVFFSYAIFPLPDLAWVRVFNLLNVPGIFVIGVRELIVLGRLSNPLPFGIACVLALLVFALGVRTFHRLEAHMIERL